MVVEGGWRPTRSLDRDSRLAKAAKIATLIEQRRALSGVRLLEVGTGGGIIASVLSERVGPLGEVVSVDVEDFRSVTDGYAFQMVEGVELPFTDATFDVVVSNHTIEHVGGPEEQLVHLQEMARVLRPDGLGYLASPSRWALVEPHFRVPFLSWLPPVARSNALRLVHRGSVYDVSPRARGELLDLIARAGLRATDVTVEALRITLQVERPGLLTRATETLPEPVLHVARRAIPTMVFVLYH
jgi:SAM-dependent methyltransferase